MIGMEAAIAEYRWTGMIAHGAGQDNRTSVGFFAGSYCITALKIYRETVF